MIWRINPNTSKDELFDRVVKNGLVKIEHSYYKVLKREGTGRSYTAEYSHY